MVYITGDMHADFSRFSAPEMRPLKRGDTLIVCGDFGFLWSGGRAEQKVLKKLTQLPYTILFLDGTHENFDLLRDYPVIEWNGGRVQEIRANIRHLLRGEIYEIENETYFAFGGGETADPSLRTETATWWEEEMPSLEEYQEALANLERVNWTVDCVLTHCAPSGVVQEINPSYGTDELTDFLEMVSQRCKFAYWFFGHYHENRIIDQKYILQWEKISELGF